MPITDVKEKRNTTTVQKKMETLVTAAVFKTCPAENDAHLVS